MTPVSHTPKVSIVIPWHFMENWEFFLGRCLKSIEKQSFKDYEIILTKAGSMPVNTNRAIKAAEGELIKVLYMDDYLTDHTSLGNMVSHFQEDSKWLVTACVHDNGETVGNYHKPSYNDQIHTGKNTIGSPSVLMMRKDSLMFFDEKLSWLLDCDLYSRLYAMYGEPTIVEEPDVVIGLHPGQTSNLMSDEDKLKEKAYIEKKYE